MSVLSVTRTGVSAIRGRLAKVGGSLAGALTAGLTAFGVFGGRLSLGEVGTATRTGGLLFMFMAWIASMGILGLGLLSLRSGGLRRWVGAFSALILGAFMMFLAILPGFPVMSILGAILGGCLMVGGITMAIMKPMGRAGAIVTIVLGGVMVAFTTGIVLASTLLVGGGGLFV